MSDYHIIDRRQNPRGKNLPNRQKFLKKVKKYLKDRVRDAMNKRRITDEKGENVSVPIDSISEPSFDFDRNTGEWDQVLPGNRNFVVGDKIKKPPSGSGQGGGKEAGKGGNGEDNFRFTITREEYLDMVFEDLELPDMVKKSEKAATVWHRIRAGFKTDGNPSQLDLIRSMKNGLGRRLALRKPVERQIQELQQQLDQDPENAELKEEIEKLKRKHQGIPWIDPMDIRYRRWDLKPVPNSQAVIFCLMDVSGSMGDKEKEIAKRFYLLLYLFLQRQYEKVQIVFVRHTDTAKEVEEQEFFHSQESGGTVVSSGLELINDIITKRYPLDAWNVYIVQASDGDNYNSDNQYCRELLTGILPKVQYYVYAEVREIYSMQRNMILGPTSGLWDVMYELTDQFAQLTTIKLPSVENVVPVFRQVFSKVK
jgi:uncharacterized sporulation protein YeaH/YhbH (DUF444 family)